MARGKRAETPTTNGSGGTPSEGHNIAGMSEDKFFELKREIESCEREKNTAVANLRTARKRAKDAGMNMKAFDLVRKMRQFTAPELTADLNKIIAYAKFEKLPVYSQLDIFEPIDVSDDERMQEAHALGVVAGKSGTLAERNPWTLDTPMGREWANGHLEGSKSIGAA